MQRDIHLDCRMKTAGCLFSGCLDDMKKGEKKLTPHSLSSFPASIIKIVVRNLRDVASLFPHSFSKHHRPSACGYHKDVVS